MKKLHLAFALMLIAFSGSAQKVYFIYIQAEPEQPFYVKMNERIQSSTGSGYIILSKLVDSTYKFTIGFPQNKWASQQYSVAIAKKDHGYLLKNFGEKGWGLYDLQTMEIQMGVADKAYVPAQGGGDAVVVSAFTRTLALAADNPSLLEQPVRKPVETKTGTLAVVDKKTVPVQPDAAISSNTEVVNVKMESREITVAEKPTVSAGANPVVETAKEVSVPAEPVQTSPVVAAKADPAVIEVPATQAGEIAGTAVAKTQASQSNDQPVAEAQKEIPEAAKEELVVADSEYKPTQVKRWSESSTTEGFGLVFIDQLSGGLNDTIRLLIPNPKSVVALQNEDPADTKAFISQKEVVAKSALPARKVCVDVATEVDYAKLLKKMAAHDGDDDMIAEAKKYFTEKCFTTVQVKNLGALFLTDEAKYRFFDAAYPYVSDAEAFNSLQSELKDDYYASRFKAMLRN